MNNLLFYAVPAMGVIGLLYTLIKFNWVSKQDAGNARMKEISTYIAEGAMAFLKAEWKILAYFVVIVAILLGFMAQSNEDSHWSIAISFFIGAVFSATAGYIGMKVATKANVRTAEAARTSLSKALNVFIYRWCCNGLRCIRTSRFRFRWFVFSVKAILLS